MSKIAVCMFCGKNFTLSSCFINEKYKNRGKYCSRECFAKHRIKTRFTKYCPCGKEIKVSPWLLNRKKYCSKSCMYKYHTMPKRGPLPIEIRNKIRKTLLGNIPWNKGLIGLQVAWNKGIKGVHFSSRTEFKRTNGNGYRHLLYKGLLVQRCIVCGETNIKRLQIHHIDRDRKNNDIKNLEVQCRKCHLQIHGRVERTYVLGRTGVSLCG